MLVEFNLSSGCSAYTLMIPAMASFEPNTNAIRPNIETTMFFNTTQLYGPKPLSQYVTNSMAT